MAIAFPPLLTPILDLETAIATPHWSNYFNTLALALNAIQGLPPELPLASLLGRGAVGPGPVETITLGEGLLMTGSVLSAPLPTPASVTPFPNTELTVLDPSNPSLGFFLTLRPASILTANRTLNFDTGNTNRTLTLQGDTTLADWFNQSVKTTASPTFVAATLGGLTVNGFGFTVNGSPTLDDWFNQDVKTTASPQFTALQVSGQINTGQIQSGAYKYAGNSGVFASRRVEIDGGGTWDLTFQAGICTHFGP